jgi:uncharacterized protein DUF5946
MTERPLERAGVVACVGCGGLVPDEDGPIHRYMTASPGCWRIYTELGAAGLPSGPWAGLTVDAYAVTHPGVAGPQSTPSVWIHLLTLCFILERGWPVDRAIALRRAAADSFDGWPWLQPPTSMGVVTAVDVAEAMDPDAAAGLVRGWVEGAWMAWSVHHPAIRARADRLSTHFA